jgi:hypothetical protein
MLKVDGRAQFLEHATSGFELQFRAAVVPQFTAGEAHQHADARRLMGRVEIAPGVVCVAQLR